ncbi:MAG TPA: triose-phosphate isomerase [Gemmatimonadales bacterium]|nr:triose-phosphate isomerase [Gemmatimonadales bacterium]
MPERPATLFAANWKMHLGPAEAREYAAKFRAAYTFARDRETWFFPSAVSLESATQAFSGLPGARTGVQNVHWEPKGAFTGATSVPLAGAAGATAALVGHSERRHVFGETDEETGRKVRAVLAGGLMPLLCVGEKIEERELGQTAAVVNRQLNAGVRGLTAEELDRVVVAYEPVWAIGTGRNATPKDAALVHAGIRRALMGLGAGVTRILYGGSVNAGNAAALLAESEIDGVLVGGASLDPVGWAGICSVEARRQ